MSQAAWDWRPLLACGVTSCLVAAFVWHQNHSTAVGGPTGLANAFWLNLTVIVFLVVPAVLWRASGLHGDLRLLFALGFALFAIRVAVELPILYLTTAWRCLYGIAHDLSVFGILLVGYVICRERIGPAQQKGAIVLGLYLALLLAEACFAWQFSLLADPAQGIYFAADTPHFSLLNLTMWAVLIPAYPLLAVVLWPSTRRAR